MDLLLLHGFTSHPLLTLGPLPQALREANFEAGQPALPGHGKGTPGVLPKVQAPALVGEAGRDRVVQGVRRCHELWGSPRKDYRVFPESGHDLLPDREAVAQAVRD